MSLVGGRRERSLQLVMYGYDQNTHIPRMTLLDEMRLS